MVAGVPSEALVVFLLIVVALVFFVSEMIPNDVTAIGIIVALAALAPTLGITSRDAISGFANPATITIIAMYMLSAGIQNTGLIERLGIYLSGLARGDERRALAATIATTGPIAGFINNTPVVAVFIPMITDLAKRSNVSPSKLLLPLSYAAILGGTLTLIGTSTNLLASDLSRQLIPGRDGISMFEFLPLGIVVLLVGIAYLMTIGRRLTPARIPVDADLVEEFDLEDHLAQLQVRAGSPLVGFEVTNLDEGTEAAVDVLQLRRDGAVYAAPYADRVIEAEDVLVVNGTLQAINRFREDYDLRHRVRASVTEGTFEDAPTGNTLSKAVVPEGSAYVGETLEEARLDAFHRTTVLAIRRGSALIRRDLQTTTLQAGDLLLVRLPPEAIDYFTKSGDLLVTDDLAYERLAHTDAVSSLSPKTPITIGIMAGVVSLAALDVLPISIAALGGVFTMIVTGCLSPSDAYDAVSWNIVFLLAGVIPLGLAMETTGGAALVAAVLVASEAFLPLFFVLFLFYVLTGLLSSVITPVATVVLMIPVAVDAAGQMGADPFSFLLAVMFAAATSFMTPVGYQTNLMVYGPGGYRFTDFLRVGGPLQLLLAVVATTGIALLWGLT
ncbi:MAG: SLC13 family permease [Natronomonas sp.]